MDAPDWDDHFVRRDLRDRRAALVPSELPLLGPEDMDLLRRWVRADSPSRGRDALLKLSGPNGIERAEALCDRLLRAGWLERREALVRGSWQWERVTWRDLDRLKGLLGVGSKSARDSERQAMLAAAQQWFAQRVADKQRASLDPDLVDEMTRALDHLGAESSLKPDILATRIALVQAVGEWHDAGRAGVRRDFALAARGTTKAIGPADWHWLELSFDLERLRIAQFAPMLWIAGELSLCWGEKRVDAGAIHCIGVALADVLRADRVVERPSRYWLVENRASFERQAQSLEPGEVLMWLPGRPSKEWLLAMQHLLRLAPAPARVSADADPAGVDIACTVGRLWAAHGQPWAPHRMGLDELQSTRQRWELNAHDRALLDALLARADLRPELRALCETMRREGRKAEQEGWL